jgi:hypothetical protein
MSCVGRFVNREGSMKKLEVCRPAGPRSARFGKERAWPGGHLRPQPRSCSQWAESVSAVPTTSTCVLHMSVGTLVQVDYSSVGISRRCVM